MKHLTKLFKLLELTRSMPQYGYVLGGIQQDELSNLAEHQYLVTMLAWQMARNCNAKGAKLKIEKVLEFCLVHDLGELLGGDIAMPYAKANPKARKFAKAFESENQKYLAHFFGADSKHFSSLMNEIMDVRSDEAIIYKIADLMEVTHYKLYVRHFIKEDVLLVSKRLNSLGGMLKDKIAKLEILAFVKSWKKEVSGNNHEGHILFEMWGKGNR